MMWTAEPISSLGEGKIAHPLVNSLSTLAWRPLATPALRSAAKHRNLAAFGQSWLAEAAPRTVPPPLDLSLLYDHPVVRESRHLFEGGHQKRRGPARATMKVPRSHASDASRLMESLSRQSEPWSPVEGLVAVQLLFALAHSTSPESVGALWERLAVECRRPRTSAELPDERLVRTGELPLLAGRLLEPSREARNIGSGGRKSLVRELMSQTDRDGTPQAELLPRLVLWLASLVRATLWAQRLEIPLWTPDERDRLSRVLERAVPLCRPDGRLAMSNGLAVPALPVFLAASHLLPFSGPAAQLLRTLPTHSTTRTLRKPASSAVKVMPSSQSDWARFALLRSDWNPRADTLVVAHHQSIPELEVAASGRPVLHGAWGLELQIGEVGIEPAPEWACSCWLSDPDADYLELQMSGRGGLRVERQVLLSRKEHFLLLADCVRGARKLTSASDVTPIHLRSRFPLAEGVSADSESRTREVRLKSGRQSLRVFPLALADDRIQSTPHNFSIENRSLVLHQVGTGNGLYAPVVFDWHPARSRLPALWRTLTVTEGGQVIGRDLAAGHRLQIGSFQLLIYRSLAPMSTPRAVLGHHTYYESVIAKFDRNGDVEPIMNVEE